MFVIVCAMGVPVFMDPPWDFPSWQAVGLYLAWFIPCLVINYALVRITMRTLLKRISFAVDSGFLVTYHGRHRHWYRTDLSKVTKAEVGDIEHPDEMRIQLVTHLGCLIDIPTTDHMEEFVATVASCVPVEMELRNEPLPIWTRLVVLLFGISALFLVVFFTSLSYVFLRFL